MNLEETAAHIAKVAQTPKEIELMILKALVAERQEQQRISEAKMKQAVPDLRGQQLANADYMSTLKRMGDHMRTIELLVVRQRHANREDRETVYKLILELEQCSLEGSTTAKEALERLNKDRPNIKKQMRTWRP